MLANTLKLLPRLQSLVDLLNANQNFHIHRNIDQFFYMQKIAELKHLCDELQLTEQRLTLLQQTLQSSYCTTLKAWSHDFRYLSRNLK